MEIYILTMLRMPCRSINEILYDNIVQLNLVHIVNKSVGMKINEYIYAIEDLSTIINLRQFSACGERVHGRIYDMKFKCCKVFMKEFHKIQLFS